MISQFRYCVIILSILFSITDVSEAKNFLEIDENEMDLTEDQLKALSGDFDPKNLDDGELVKNNISFKWDYGVIPYEFNNTQIFEENFRNKIVNAIHYLNQNHQNSMATRTDTGDT